MQNKSKFSEDFFRLKPIVIGVRLVIASGLFVGSGLTEVNANPILNLPDPVIHGLTITDGSAAHGNATMTINGNQEIINQTTNKAIIDWNSFNIGPGYSVNFVQPSATSSALNNIHDANASQILGTLTANGQVYLVNNNGFIFGKDSSVDANTLVASALNISDANFNGGIIRTFDNNNGAPALSGGAATDATISVDAGASIKAGQSGTVILAAPNVNNSGAISADQQGQIILVASKDNVYLQPASKTSPFAGLLVEVGTGGNVNNNAGANVAVREGNITLAGFAVNQSGRLSATTSVNVNGSIRLLARENAQNIGTTVPVLDAYQTVRNAGLVNEQDSSVTFGVGSSTSVLADANGGTAINGIAQHQSYVEVSADKIEMQSGSAIVATDGAVNLTAQNTLDTSILAGTLPGNPGRIDLQQGSTIDVSGSTNTILPMSRNVVGVSVQSFNLRNSPYQRGGVLQGQTIQVDVRNLPTIFDASSAPASIQQGINERLSAGGTINLNSYGDVIVNSGAVVNIAGGAVTYQSGYLNTTQLVNASTGQIVDIRFADPNQQYSAIYGVYSENHAKWGVNDSWNIMTPQSSGVYEAGYTQGAVAGSLNIESPITAWAGQLIAGTTTNIYQRTNPASGGSFTINQGDTAGQFLSNQNVIFQNSPVALQAINFNDPTLATSTPIILSTDLVNRSGISNLKISTSGVVTVAKDANLSLASSFTTQVDSNGKSVFTPLSTFAINASTINMLGSIYNPSGNINLTTTVNPNDNNSGKISLLANSQLNVSGRWINDFKDGVSAPLTINGGTVSLTSASSINFNQGATIKADGGAQLNLSGNGINAGNAGSIKLTATDFQFSSPTETQTALSAIGLGKGGSLNLTNTFNKINIGSNNPSAFNLGVTNGSLDVAVNAGFSSINLNSTQQDIMLSANTNWSFGTKNRLLNSNYRDESGAATLAGFSQITTLPENLRSPVTLTLNGYNGVTLEKGSQLHVEKNSTVNITDNQGPGIYINGLIDAQAGNINLKINPLVSATYDPTQAIWLGSQGGLNVQGTTVLNPVDALGRQTGTVLNGGNINVSAQQGYVVLEQGSNVNVNGTKASLNVPVPNSLLNNQQVIGSNAGNINITAAEGIVLDGAISAQKGLASNSGGSLNLTLDRGSRNIPNNDYSFSSNSLHIDVVQQNLPTLSSNVTFGTNLDALNLNGQAVVSSNKIQQAGIDSLSLNLPYLLSYASFGGYPNPPAGDIRFLNDVTLNTASSIVLNAQDIISGTDGVNNVGTAQLNTGYLKIGSSSIDTVVDTSVLGNGSFTGNAKWIDLQGSSLLTGFNTVNLNSQHDIRVIGNNITSSDVNPVNSFIPNTYTGVFQTAANLNLNASQIYPTTLTQFTFNVTDPTSRVSITGQNADVTPLSAAGSLIFNAPNISQAGVLKAPLGTITLNAIDTLSFANGSYTSVSAEGLVIPFGTVKNNVWQYALAGSNANANYVYNLAPDYQTIGSKNITLNAPNIQLNKGSVVNVSGGGNLMTATFQPGGGGGFDYLMPGGQLNTSSSNPYDLIMQGIYGYKNAFAILPSISNSITPYDPSLATNFANDPRAEVYLNGTANLLAGFYTILPAYDALLPGAFLVTPQTNILNQQETSYTSTGLPIVAGYQTIAGTNIQPALNSGYLIESSAQVQTHTQYNINYANTFFANQAAINGTSVPLLPQDAGQVSINASTQLVLDAQFKASAPNGRGAKMDISATNIDVVKSIDPANTSAGLQILAQNLNNLQVDSLLLGGTRIFDSATGNTNLTVAADTVTFDKGVTIQAFDLLAAGKVSVNVLTGATINASGQVNTGDSKINLTGDSALLRVSADKQIQLNRLLDPYNPFPGSTGDLLIDSGATLSASQSMLLAASHSMILNGNINMSGGSISMLANAINLGDVAALPATALNLTNQNLTNMLGNDLTLTSQSAINFYGDVGQLVANNVQPIQFKNLVLDANSLSGYAGATLGTNTSNVAMLKADTLTIQNTSGSTSTTPGAGSGALDLTATQFNVGKGTLSFDGFSTTNINVDKQFNSTANSVVNLATDLNLTAGLINTTGGHSLLLDATSGIGHNVTISGNVSKTTPVTNQLGGSIAISANNITLQDANILMPSGTLKLTAQNGNVLVNGTSNINLKGENVTFGDLISYTQGGNFSAIASNGSINLASTTALDISTGGGHAAGGSLKLTSLKNTINLAGSLKATGASATIDTLDLSGTQFDSLMTKLMTAGVNQAVYVRSRTGDIVENTAITAKSISLVADAGSIDIFGKLSTDSVAQAGNINLYAGNNITLESGSAVSATGTKGGNVLLSALGTATTPGGIISINTGASIDVTGSSSLLGTNSAGGTVTLDAMRNTGSTGININPINGSITGASGLYAVGFKKYDAAFVSSMSTPIADIASALSTVTIPYGILFDPNIGMGSQLDTLYLFSSAPDYFNFLGNVSTDINNYFNTLTNGTYYTSNDIAGLSAIVQQEFSNFISLDQISVNPVDLATINSDLNALVTTSMAAYLAPASTNFAGLSNTINTDVNSYMNTYASTIQTNLGHSIAVRTGVEIDNTNGPMTLASAWDFSGLSNNGISGNNQNPLITFQNPIVGDLIVRSVGQLNINAPLTDGYVNGGPTLMNSDSWSFQLVSGADLSSADTMATNNLSAADKLINPNIGDLTLGSGASVHTGTGDINLAAGGNIVFADQTATVYSGGRSSQIDPYGTLDNQHTGYGSPYNGAVMYSFYPNGAYPIDGGSVTFQAGADIFGAVSNQFIQSSWLNVQGQTPLMSNLFSLTAWMVDASQFQQNIGSFGGGAVNVNASGNINDLSVMMPTTGKQLGTSNTTNALDVEGGGLMNISAGGNIYGGAYYLGQGVGTISAGGEITGSQQINVMNAFVSGPQLVMSGNQSDPINGNTSFTLNANQGIKISGVSDAMVLYKPNGPAPEFFSYTDKSKLTLNSLGGDIHLNSDTSVMTRLLSWNPTDYWQNLANVYPASMDATAFNGSVVLGNDIILFPSALSNVNVLANQSISSDNTTCTNGLCSLTMSDANPSLIGTANNVINTFTPYDPVFSMFNTSSIDSGTAVSQSIHAQIPVHTADKTPARFVTQVGDISRVQINMPKQSIIQAGNDLVNSPILIQQINAYDTSVISAGRDIKFVTDLFPNFNWQYSQLTPTSPPIGIPGSLISDSNMIQVAGPGTTLLKSGRNLDLGSAIGLSSVGNLYNSALSSTGANLDILVGLNGGVANYSAFIDKYIVTNPLYVTQYKQLTALITPFMQQMSSNPLMNDAQALAAFANLAPNQTLSIQTQLNSIVSSVFFNELYIAGSASASDKTKGNAGGFTAIATLFPSNQWQGDINVYFSKIQTLSGGDINLMVPGGQVNAGLAVAPDGAKSADQLGIVTQANGAINAYVKNDFIVNTSRVMTLGGGDILIWSSDGNIDAGKGAKGALSVTIDPPYFDSTDKLVIPPPRITSGSGIRSVASGYQKAGNVSLFAPKGIVNAGEAGIGGNNVTISAAAVMGTNNIQVGGTSTGVPQASSGSLAAGLTGASNLTANVTQVAQTSAELDEKSKKINSNSALSLLSIDLLGFGE